MRHGDTTLRRFGVSSCCQIHTSNAIHTAVPRFPEASFSRRRRFGRASAARRGAAQQHPVQVEKHPASQAMAAAREALLAGAAEFAVQTIRVDGVQSVECEHDEPPALASPAQDRGVRG